MSADFPFVPCIQCGHRSYFFIETESELKLEFCYHHYRRNEPALVSKIKHLVDMSHLLK